MWSPTRMVLSMEPVGITVASATNVRKHKTRARTNRSERNNSQALSARVSLGRGSFSCEGAASEVGTEGASAGSDSSGVAAPAASGGEVSGARFDSSGSIVSFSIADRLARLDERAAHVVVADEAESQGDAGFIGVPDGGRDARIRYRHHKVGVGGVLARQPPPQHLAALLHRPPEDEAVGTRKIHMFKDALRPLDWRRKPQRRDSPAVQNHHL